MKHFAVIFFSVVFLCGAASAQTTFVIDQVPAHYTPIAEDIYMAADFDSWTLANPAFKFTRAVNGKYYLTFSTAANPIAFKFNRGDWDRVETMANGSFLADRTFDFSNDTAHFTIAQWDDMQVGNNTANNNVKVLQTLFNIPQLSRTRKIWIYLPADYYTSGDNYPVLYMQDAQNVFDALYSFAGEWKVDEALVNLKNAGTIRDCIVVGIENGPQRLDEYSPFVDQQYGGGEGDEYSDFIVSTLKPYIDNNFRTLPQPEHTGIGGSSIGGLISAYAGLKYPGTFGRVLIFSPSIWFADRELITYAGTKTYGSGQKLYFAAGTTESQDMVPDINDLVSTLKNKGFPDNQLKLFSQSGGQHSESFWAQYFPAAYTWLDLWGTTTRIDNPYLEQVSWDITSYNDSFIRVKLNDVPQNDYTLMVSDGLGRVLLTKKMSRFNSFIDVPSGSFTNGVYSFSMISDKEIATRRIAISR